MNPSLHSERNRAEALWNVAEVGAFLNASREAIYKLVERKQIPHIRLGRKIVFDPVRIRKWLETHTVEAA